MNDQTRAAVHAFFAVLADRGETSGWPFAPEDLADAPLWPLAMAGLVELSGYDVKTLADVAEAATQGLSLVDSGALSVDEWDAAITTIQRAVARSIRPGKLLVERELAI